MDKKLLGIAIGGPLLSAFATIFIADRISAAENSKSVAGYTSITAEQLDAMPKQPMTAYIQREDPISIHVDSPAACLKVAQNFAYATTYCYAADGSIPVRIDTFTAGQLRPKILTGLSQQYGWAHE